MCIVELLLLPLSYSYITEHYKEIHVCFLLLRKSSIVPTYNMFRLWTKLQVILHFGNPRLKVPRR